MSVVGKNQIALRKGSSSTTRKTGVHYPRLLWFVALALVIAALLPLWLSIYALGVLTIAYYYGVFAMSWDLLFGYAGEVNFGPTVLIGLGAYGTGLLSNMGYPVWLCLILSTMIAMVGGLALAIPALRLHGPYFGLITLVAVLLLKDIIIIFSAVTGGEIGTIVSNTLSISASVNYWYALGFMIISAALLYSFSRSSSGLILQAIGQDPVEAQALGFNVVKHKLAAFCISAVFSGLAGGLLVLYMGTASVNTVVDFGVVVQVIIAAVLGGRRTILGSMVGAIFLIVATEGLRPFGQLNTVVVSGIALVVILFMPDGMLGYFLNRRERQ